MKCLFFSFAFAETRETPCIWSNNYPGASSLNASHLTFSEPVQLSVESMIISIYVRLAANSQVDSNYGYNNEAII